MNDVTNKTMIQQLLKTTKKNIETTTKQLRTYIQQKTIFEQLLDLNNEDLNEFVETMKSYEKLF